MDYLYECHLHTAEGSGCGRNTAAEQVRAYKKRGYQGIIVTDHFINGYSTCPRYKKIEWEEKMAYVVAGYKAAKQEGDSLGLDVFLGWEYTINGSDFLTYGLGIDFLLDNPGLDLLDIKTYSSLVREKGGYLAQAHPYRDAAYIQHKFPVDPMYLDGVEVFNASDNPNINKKAMRFAEKHGLPMQAGGDSHGTDDSPSGVKLKSRAKNIQDIIEAIKNRTAEIIL